MFFLKNFTNLFFFLSFLIKLFILTLSKIKLHERRREDRSLYTANDADKS